MKWLDQLLGRNRPPRVGPLTPDKPELAFANPREAWEFMGEWMVNDLKTRSHAYGLIRTIHRLGDNKFNVELEFPANSPQRTAMSINTLSSFTSNGDGPHPIDGTTSLEDIDLLEGNLACTYIAGPGPFPEPLNILNFLVGIVEPRLHIDRGWKLRTIFGRD